MDPIKEQADRLFRESVLRARSQSPEEKLLAGPRLFDFACRVTMDGIRMQHPEADEETIREILRERLTLARKLENGV